MSCNKWFVDVLIVLVLVVMVKTCSDLGKIQSFFATKWPSLTNLYPAVGSATKWRQQRECKTAYGELASGSLG